jgi:pimeloyl-ACP methyl ester carboxylesterase
VIEEDQPAPQPDRPPETKYARSGDVNIAYQVIGDAPLDLVFVMGWVSHLDYFWREPSFARFLLRLSSFARLILFDKRGTGLSDRVPNNELPTLEQRMDDVRAVMDAAGSERAALCGVSEGGPMCSLFAATYPERTVALVMIGTYAKRIRDADYPGDRPPNSASTFFRRSAPTGASRWASMSERRAWPPIRRFANGGRLTCAWEPVPARRSPSRR